MSKNIGDNRALHVCDLCGQVDDHPRHVLAGGMEGAHPAPPGKVVRLVMANAADLPQAEQDRLLADLLDTSASDRHLDCCAAAGCPTDTCGPQVAGADGKTGADLLRHITTLDDPFADRADTVMGV